MKLAIVVPHLGFVGGVERWSWDLATALGARGHEVVLLHPGARGRDPDRYAAAFRSVGEVGDRSALRGVELVYVQRAEGPAQLEPFADLPLLVASHDHDLTCVRSSRYLPLTLEPCHRPPGVACVTHGCVVVRDRRGRGPLPILLKSPFRLRDRLLALARRAPLVACSRYVASGLVAAGVDPSRVHVLHPVPPEDPAPVQPRPAQPRLLAVGQLVRGKGFDVAIEALRRLPAEVTLDIAGDGPSRQSWTALAESLVPGRVRFLGYVPPDELGALYDAASVVVCPSRWPEPFGMVGIEAMRRARPVAAADHGGIPEWLSHGDGGLLHTPGSAESLARAARALLEDPEAGRKAHAYVLRRFPYARAVDEAEELLARVSSAH